MDSKKILILSHKPPYPKVDGGSIAISQMIEALLKIGHRVSLLYMETDKHPSLKEQFPKQLSHQSIFMDTRIGFLGACKNLFSRKSYILSRFHHKNFDKALKSTLKKESFDVVLFESLFTSSYLPTISKNSHAKLIYRSHNIEHQIWENQSRLSSNPFVKLYLELQVKRLKRQEINFWKSVKNIASISITDSQKITALSKANVNTVHLHAQEKDLKLVDQSSKIDFFHLGAMDWKPNVQGIKWLVDEVWPMLKNNKAEIHLAGRKMPKELLERAEAGLFIQGEIENASQFTSQHKVLLVPLFIGSGMRVKIIEAMAQGKCIICTKLAAQGIPFTHEENILIAETKTEFVDAINYCLQYPKKVEEIGKNARIFAADIFSQERVINQLNSLL